MDIALKREILEVSFEEIYKKQQKKHKSLDPMKLNQKLISLLSNISYENQKQFQLILLIVNNLTKKIIKENFHYLIINLYSFQVLE